MAWTLGDITLPTPRAFKRETVEMSATNESITGIRTKDIKSRKERFTLTYRYLTQVEIAAILMECNKLSTVNFAVSDGDLSIATTPVHIELNRRSYNTPGEEFREDLDLVLTERI